VWIGCDEWAKPSRFRRHLGSGVVGGGVIVGVVLVGVVGGAVLLGVTGIIGRWVRGCDRIVQCDEWVGFRPYRGLLLRRLDFRRLDFRQLDGVGGRVDGCRNGVDSGCDRWI